MNTTLPPQLTVTETPQIGSPWIAVNPEILINPRTATVQDIYVQIIALQRKIDTQSEAIAMLLEDSRISWWVRLKNWIGNFFTS